MDKKPLKLGLATLALIGGLVVAGCAASPVQGGTPAQTTPDESDTLNEMIDRGLAESKSEFQTEVLTQAKSDGEISEANWKEANNLYKSCLSEQGYEVELIFQGSKVLTSGVADADDPGDPGNPDDPATKQRQQVDVECYSKTSAHINEIYDYLNGNGGMDGDQVQRAVLQCLLDRGLVPEDTSYDEFLADLEQQNGLGFNPEGGPDEEKIRACWIEMTT